ncbi:MAG: hypothetical protein CMM44_09825 [Rhodospirillaceae bacterium]|nr:hypothetical protein [Rhodospirillaceae bacterium]|tara:strand:- start:9469 stop:10227 length:759 start_codon:yes stop_codon:yes gene_type:complete
MFNQKELLKKLDRTSQNISIRRDSNFDFNKDDAAFIIIEGSLLAYNEKNLTQTFSVGDPIGFAEVIAAREKNLRFKLLTDLKLKRFDGTDIRKNANAADVVSRTIIKYSISRIFDFKNRSTSTIFEDIFLEKNFKSLRRSTHEEDGLIFRINDTADSMYFLERGKVGLYSENNKKVAELKSGECFGEAALLHNRRRNYSAIAQTRTNLVVIERALLKKELTKDPPVVRLSVILLLKRLELTNKMNWADDFKK